MHLCVKELILIKKINATKNFTACAIIMIPKRQLLMQKTCHMTYKSVHPFFAQLTLLPIAQNPMIYNVFQSARHSQKCPFTSQHLHSHLIHVPRPIWLSIPNCISIGSAVFAQLMADSPYTLYHTTTTTVLRPFFWDNQGQPVPEANFWTLWCKGRLTEADPPTIQLGATPSRLTSAHLHHPPFCTGQMPFLLPNQQCQSTVKATSAFGLGRRR